jgi:DNA polymerase III subunit delta'
MDGTWTRGQPHALEAVRAMIGSPPHALLLVGAAGIGKTTLALDLAAGLLCTASDSAARPCGACRSCRLVSSRSHPDVHGLQPEGPGRQIVIGGRTSKVRGVRDLISELALTPVEGGRRIAIVEHASRMHDDAQAALLKTLEEPPDGVTIILCADAEEPLPTIRSRCARVRLGPVAVRDVEAILHDAGVADPPLAARLARISGGRPGIALAWARDPAALQARDELTRSLLDLGDARPAERLASIRTAMARAADLPAFDDPPDPVPVDPRSVTATPTDDAATSAGDAASDDGNGRSSARVPAVERRRAAEALVSVWTDITRDLVLLDHGLSGSIREPGLLEEGRSVAARLDPDAVVRFLDRLGRASVLLAGNLSPELVLDDLAMHWPRPGRAAA